MTHSSGPWKHPAKPPRHERNTLRVGYVVMAALFVAAFIHATIFPAW